ncbi:MAG: NAD(P)/FAD-dependent oxidoreductase [candidate division NC10 bacterium]|nr:NAD(P)/FAD-dependent oxidoreductase [candidate division NC10 bacterium]
MTRENPKSEIRNPKLATRVAVIGGGPGGTCAALALVRMAKERGRAIEVILFEPKDFGAHYNQCAGVLSPPIQGVLRRELDLSLPPGLLQRKIAGYVLYGEHEVLDMPAGDDGEATHAVRRVQFDRFLLDAAEKAGVQVERSRVYELEFGPQRVILYSDGGSWGADVVVGAFGLDRTVGEALAGRTGYRLPPSLETVVTKIHPGGLEHVPALLQDRIHAFLPRLPAIEFGALIPKGNHITIIIAGRRVSVPDMQAFLDLPQVRRLLPQDRAIEHHFKGAFPVGPARRPYGDRYVTIGDAAGLVRPFKGKGITSAALTGIRAARTILDLGISEEAFRHYYAACADITRDLWYGRAIRHLARLTSKRLSLDPILQQAHRDPALRRALYLCVSAQDTYRNIVRESFHAGLLAGCLGSLAGWLGSQVLSPRSRRR